MRQRRGPESGTQRGLQPREPTPGHRRDAVHGVEVFAIAAGPDGACAGAAAPSIVVLIHGLAVSNRYLVPCLRRLARDRRVFAPDLPGRCG